MSTKRKQSDKNLQDRFTRTDSPPKRPKLHERPSEISAMYHFPSKNADMVDLTGSSTSPTKAGVRIAPSMHANGGPKRMLVKNFKVTRKSDPKSFVEPTWARLSAALDTVFSGGKIDFSLEELYRGVENLCRQGMAEDTASTLEPKLQKGMDQLFNKFWDNAQGFDHVDFLRATVQTWETWMERMKYVLWIFYYLDRSYLLPKGETLLDQGKDCFRHAMLTSQEDIGRRIIDGTCALIAVDREGKDMDRDTFKKALNLFQELKLYHSHFEPRMLELSQEYIAKWAEREAEEKSAGEYAKAALKLMDDEGTRVDMFNLPGSTRRDLFTLMHDLLITKRESKLTNPDELADILEANSVTDAAALYKLLNIRSLGESLREPFMKWIEDTGTAIVFDEKDEDNMVVNLLALKRQLDTFWKQAFNRNSEIGHGLREAFEVFMNKTKKTSTTWNTDNSKPGEMIAKYVDMLLRGGAKAIPAALSRKAEKQPGVADDKEETVFDEDSEVDNQLDQVLDLFRFVHGKAVFEAFYKKDLARRLLMGKSASADAELSMLGRLKNECGAAFTANLEKMFKDIELSREEMASYNSILEERREKQPLDLNVNVLSAAAWPAYPTVPVIIPPEIKSVIDKFEKHYKVKHQGRSLDWKHSLAFCQVKAKFPRGPKELVVSSFQAVVLLLFNGIAPDEHIDYNYIKEATGLPLAELERTLQSLACAKIRPLTKHPKGRDIKPTDTFTLNANFSDPKYRIKVNQVQLKETAAENKETHERVAADRQYETQAAIVRIMKARKTIAHSELVAETIKATKSRGTLDVSGIKRNIDRLIEKDFIEREEDGMYSYIA